MQNTIRRDNSGVKKVGKVAEPLKGVARAVVDCLPGMVCILDPQGCVVHQNKAMEALGARLGSPLSIICEADRIEFSQKIEEALRGDSVEWKGRLATSGRARHVWLGAKVVKFSRTQALLLTAIELPTHDALAEALAALEERYRIVVKNAGQIVYDLDVTSGKIFWQGSVKEVTGWSVEEFQWPNLNAWAILVHPDDRDRVFPLIQQAIQRPGSYTTEYRYQQKDGAYVFIKDQGVSLADPAGRVRRLVGTMVNVTEKKALERQVLRGQRLESLGALAGGIAHDLNNILSPISMSASMLRNQSTQPKVLEMANSIETSAKRGAEIVRQVLTFARGVEGERSTVEIRHLVGDMIKFAQETFPKSIVIRKKFPLEMWGVSGDTTQLHQVLLNLCLNARDAMPEGGVLTIRGFNRLAGEIEIPADSAAQKGPFVELSVSDTGTGISSEIVDKIFDPFFTTKKIGQGTGLGLSTAMGIVKSHGGFMKVLSEQGGGATFQVFLPATLSQPLAPAPKPVRELRGKGEMVLVVDDEPSIRDLTGMALEQRGYRALLAANGPEAMTLFAQNVGEISLVITDMMMPIMDGATLIHTLRKVRPDIRVVATSGLDQKDCMRGLGNQTIAGFLLKPCTVRQMISVVHDALRT